MKRFLVVAALLPLGGCITSQTMPLAPNMVQIDTKASGLLFTGQAVPETMRQASKATLEAGYTHFKFQNAATGIGAEQVSSCGWGRYGGGCSSGVRDTTNNRVTVIMFRATDPQAKDAFDAAATLAKYSQ
jgi:hypothetical protein